MVGHFKSNLFEPLKKGYQASNWALQFFKKSNKVKNKVPFPFSKLELILIARNERLSLFTRKRECNFSVTHFL